MKFAKLSLTKNTPTSVLLGRLLNLNIKMLMAKLFQFGRNPRIFRVIPGSTIPRGTYITLNHGITSCTGNLSETTILPARTRIY